MKSRYKRISIVGLTCSGKTTLAKKLSNILEIPHTELDAVFWKSNWQQSTIPAFRQKVKEITDHRSWIIDGNYLSAQDIVLAKTEILIWLNFPIEIIFLRALRRTIKRLITREEIFSGNRERFFEQFFTRKSLFWWLFKTYRTKIENNRFLFDNDIYSHLEKIELRNRRQVGKFLEQIGK